jgi:hypothetical protein
MDHRDLTRLLIKVSGAIIIAVAISSLPAYISAGVGALETSRFAFFTVAIFPLILPLLVGIFMMAFPGIVANRLIGSEKVLELSATLLDQLERVAIGLLGIYLLFRAVSDLVLHVTKLLWFRHLIDTGAVADSFGSLVPDTVGLLAASATEAAVSIWFIAGSAGIVSFIHKLRARGTEE